MDAKPETPTRIRETSNRARPTSPRRAEARRLRPASAWTLLLAASVVLAAAGAPRPAAALYRCYGQAIVHDSTVDDDYDTVYTELEEPCPLDFGPFVKGGSFAHNEADTGWARGETETTAIAVVAGLWENTTASATTYHDTDFRLEGPAGQSVSIGAMCLFEHDLEVSIPSTGLGSASYVRLEDYCQLRNLTTAEGHSQGGQIAFQALRDTLRGPVVDIRASGSFWAGFDPAADLGCVFGTAPVSARCQGQVSHAHPPIEAAVGDTLRISVMARGLAQDSEGTTTATAPSRADHTVRISLDLPPGYSLTVLDTCDPNGENCETVDGDFRPLPACGNGVDDDGDGLVDFVGGDPGCTDADDPSERDPRPGRRCGLVGLEAAAPLLLLAARRRRRAGLRR
jgi:hypothetical protein